MTPTYQHIQFRLDDRVARITFAKPPLNVFNIEMMHEIVNALGQCARRELVAIVFDADKSCRAFSAGVAVEEHVQETIFQMLDAFHAIFPVEFRLADRRDSTTKNRSAARTTALPSRWAGETMK